MFIISADICLPESEIELTAIRSQGAGGQNVNKVATAIHLRFNIAASSLPAFCKESLLAMTDKRITKEGDIVIKAQRFRTQEKNRDDALARLAEIIQQALHKQKTRLATRPTRASKTRRLAQKSNRSEIKRLRAKVTDA